MEKLLDYFTPESYHLELCLFRDRELIEGTVRIEGVSNNRPAVKFHAVNMEILEVSYTSSHSEKLSKNHPASCQFEYDHEILTIPIPETLYDSKLSFSIRFKAQLNHNMQGCYLSTYEWQGQQQKIIATQFESHYAREAFPCIDEPAAKATFSLVLTVPDRTARDVVLANTPLISQASRRFEFAPTPRMSTYLLAWVIGPLQSVSTVNSNGVKVSSYCALTQSLSSLLFANETAARALEYYDGKFQEKYPLEKLDQVALPDFEAGAMENWGLVTYRESMMLCSADSAIGTKQSVAVTVTHELSHQWFGNLVTMSWWDDLWLNESFATMMEYFCTDALYPEFKIWQDFFTHDAVAALRRDCLPGVQAVQQPVHNPAEIATLFDGAIVYAKGARLMLMLNRLMGEERFNQGICQYFDHYKYQNTVADDLWGSLQPYADFDVKAFMHSWISQPGYPTILDGEQRRFLITGETDDTTWPLPEIFDDMSGHYLLNLTDEEFQQKLTNFDRLSTEQRLRVLIDRSLLAKTPTVASASLLDLLPKFVDECTAAVWEIVVNIMNDLKLFCPPETPAAKNYQTYLSQLFAPRFRELDYGDLGGDADAIALRDTIIGIAIYVRDSETLANLDALYSEDLSTLSSELRGSILAAHLFADEASAFPSYLKAYQSTSNPELKSDLLFVLGVFSKHPAHLKQLLGLLSKPEIVRPQDHIFLYIYLLRNHYTREQTLDWLIKNWSYVEQLTGEKSIEDYPRYAAALLRTPAEAKKFYNFFDQKQDDPILKRTLKMSCIEIDARLDLIQRDSKAVQARLRALAREK